MRGSLRSQFAATSFVLIFVAAAATSASAQLTQFGPAVTTVAPAAGISVDLKLDVLAAVPDDALGFVTVHQVRDLKTTVENVLRKLNVPFDNADEYGKFGDFLDSLKGWNDEAAHVLAFFGNPEDDDPLVAGFVPVKNYAEFIKSLGAEGTGEGPVEFEHLDDANAQGWVALKDGHAVITESSDDGKALLTRILTSKKSLAASCEPIRKWLGEQQVAAVATTAGVQKAVDVMLEQLKNAENEVPDDAIGKQMAPIMLNVARQGLQLARSELTHVAFAPNVDETKGLRFQVRAVYPAGGKVSGFMGGLPSLPADSLKYLSGEDYFSVQSSTNLQALVEPSMNFAQDVLKQVAENNKLPFDAAEWQALMKESAGMWKGVEYTSTVTAFVPGAGLYDGMCGIVKVAAAADYLTKSETLMKKAWAALQKINNKLPELPLAHRKINDRDVISIKLDVIQLMAMLSPADPTLAQSQAMMKQMIGKDGNIEALITTVGDKHLIYAFNEDTLATIAENISNNKAGLADNVLIQQTAALLPRDLTAVGYVDIGGYVELVKQMMSQAMAGQGGAGFVLPIPPFPNAPPFGYSLKGDATAIEGDLVIPMDLMTAVRDYVLQIMAVFGGGGLNLN